MKSFLITIVVALLCLESTKAMEPKEPKDSIRIEYAAINNRYYIDGKEHSRGEIIDILDENPFTKDMMWSSSSSTTWGYVFTVAGAYATLYTVYNTALNVHSYGSMPAGPEFYIITGMAFIFDILGPSEIVSSNTKFKKAIQQYNEHLPEISEGRDYKLNLHIGYNSIGVSVQF